MEANNTAAMREALEKIVELTAPCEGVTSIELQVQAEALTALSAPSRNCDRFGGDKDKLFDCYIQERKFCKYKDLFPDYGFWLLKTAKTKGEDFR